MKTLKKWFIKIKDLIIGLLKWLKEVVMNEYECAKGVVDSIMEHSDDKTKKLFVAAISATLIISPFIYLYVTSERDRRSYNLEVLRETFAHEEEMNRILKVQTND